MTGAGIQSFAPTAWMRHAACLVMALTCSPLLPAGVSGQTQAPVAQEARTDDGPPPPAAYERLVQLGFAEFEAANYAEARSRFSDAYDAFPNARVLRALAKAEYELKNYAAAVRAFEAALRHDVRPLSPQQRADTERTLAEAKRYLVRHVVETRPVGAELLLDGQSVAREPDGSLVIPIGDHVLEARLPGHHVARRTLHVLGGADRSVVMVMTPLSAARRGDDLHRPIYKEWWLWTTVGVVAAAGAATAAILLTRDPGQTPFHKSTTGLILNIPSGEAP